MNKKIIAVICAASLAAGIYVPVTAEEPQTLFSHDFTDSAELDLYAENAEGSLGEPLNASSGSIEAHYAEGWNAENGIKTNITEYVKGEPGVYGASVDFLTSDYYGNPAVLAFEIVGADGGSETVTLESKIGAAGEFTTFKGSSELNISDGDTVYLTMTHYTGWQKYDNITLIRGEFAQDPKPPAGGTENIFTHDFADSAELSLYAPNADGTLSVTDGVITGEFASGWNAENGIKTDITEYVSGEPGTYSASVDFLTWDYYDNPAILAFEIVGADGGSKKINLEVKIGTNGAFTAFTGSAALDVSETDTVYLTMTHVTGNQRYDNVSLMRGEYNEKTELLTLDFSGRDDADGFMAYDCTVQGEYEIYSSDGVLISNFPSEGWNVNHGVKLDITDLVSGCGGAVFGASAEVFSWYFGGTDAKIFLEAVSPDGSVKSAELGSGIAEDGQYARLGGEAAFSFGDGDRVYLCITHPSGTQRYDNIELYVYGKAAGAAEKPEKPQIVPSDATAFFLHDFSDTAKDSQLALYSPCAGGEIAGADIRAMKLTGGGGIKTDVSEYVKLGSSGDTFGAALITKPDSSDTVTLVIEVRDAVGELKSAYTLASSEGAVPTDGTFRMGTGWITLSGESAVEFDETDTIYLCTAQTGGNAYYDDICFWGKVTSGSEEKLTAYTPALDADGAKAAFTNTTAENRDVRIYTVSYDGAALREVRLTSAAVPAGAIGYEVAIPGGEGDTVLVWDSDMKPLAEKTVLAQTRMTGTWSAAAMDVFQLREPDFSNMTIRQRARLSTGGDRLTLEFSNEYGYGDLTIKAAHIALPMDGSVIRLETDTAVTFGGSESVTIPRGETVVSDPVYFRTEDMSEVAVTIQIGEVPYNPVYNEWSTGLTGHEFSNSTTYIMENAPVGALSMSLGETVNSWVFLSGINVMTDTDNETIVCFGDSITDGVGSLPNGNTRYPDYLAALCRQNPETAHISVLNKGIGGNAVISGSVGPMAKDRFERDVLSIDGVKSIVLLEGINDIGKASADDSYSTDIINVYKDFITKAHEKGIKIYCGTILPCGNFSGYYSDKEEKLRSEINAWIRSAESGFDGVVDFDLEMRDASDPALLDGAYDCGDGLHPNSVGYELMGGMVYNTIFGK